MLHGKEEDIQDFTKNFRDEFKKTAPEKIAPIKSVNYIKKFQDGRGGILKGAPYQTKAAIAFNEMLAKHGVEEKYEKINENDKIKLLDLTSKEMPVLGFKTVLPREFSIDNLIDYDTIFDKTFAKPIDAILQIIGWNIEKKADLSWF